ncbi:hypothetical protein J437_LFUL000681 [Ladona fulva]|uniref:Uncharacterized protein n=1 Tax=Ladona fulva TaxID=123851 RepID=A0A8K0K3C8_LADFU|nr:hypothetical protein J437_LFUL000681 [Ladona fulva]
MPDPASSRARQIRPLIPPFRLSDPRRHFSEDGWQFRRNEKLSECPGGVEVDDSHSSTSEKRSGISSGTSSIVPAPGARPVLGWSPWSEWSTCSRSCDGGASFQLRRCNAPTGCRGGDAVRYKICNMQPCPESRDFREQQCEAFNETPRDGVFYRWVPHHDDSEPCALICRAEHRVKKVVKSLPPPAFVVDEDEKDLISHTSQRPKESEEEAEEREEEEGGEEEKDEEEEERDPSAAMADDPRQESPQSTSPPSFRKSSEVEDNVDDELEVVDPPLIAKLSHKVLDGTRCRSGSLDMCISGQCQVSAILRIIVAPETIADSQTEPLFPCTVVPGVRS